MSGPTSVSGSQPGPRRSRSAAGTSLRLERLVDRALDDDPARGGAALTGGAERGPEDALDGEVEVGVVEDDHRVLAAELEMDVLERVGGHLRDADAGLAGAGEGDDAHVGMRHERLAGVLAEAVDRVDDAVGESRVGEQLDEALRQQRRVLRRLEDDGVAADEGGRELPRRDRDREVPGRDRPDDADRLADAHHELVRQLGGGRLAEQAPALARHVEAHVDRLLDVAARLGEHLPHLAAHELGELLLALGQERREAVQDVRALRRRDQPPGRRRPRRARSTARATSAAVARGHGPERLSRRRIEALEQIGRHRSI